VNEKAASAGYGLASAADMIYMSDNGQAGSIGVLLAIQNIKGALEKQGVGVKLIYSGAHKVDGNPFEEMSADVTKKLQSEVDKMRIKFADSVAAGRGSRLTAAAVLATEAQMYTGQEAVDAGLADGVATLEEVISMMQERISLAPGQSNLKGISMSQTPVVEATAVADNTQALAAAEAKGFALGATAERDRIKSIMNSDSAKNRQKLASHIAFSTGLMSADAEAMLSASAPEVVDVPKPATTASVDAKLLELADGAGLKGGDKMSEKDSEAELHAQWSAEWKQSLAAAGMKVKEKL
jgi:ClpP class serine protease